MKTLLNQLTGFAALLLAPLTLLAHEGHAEPGSVAHSLHHASWMGFAALLIVCAVLLALLVERKDDDSL